MSSGAFSRWRHSRGFGVHSPFAFRIIMEVLADRYAYYGYHQLDVAAHRHKASAAQLKEARLLLRLTGRLGLRHTILLSEPTPLVTEALKAACSKMNFLSAPTAGIPTLLYAQGMAPKQEIIITTLRTEGSIVLLRGLESKEKGIAAKALTQGLILESTDSVLLISRSGMGRMHYDCKF